MKQALQSSNRRGRFGFMEYYEISDINDPDSVYLRRWYIVRTPWFGVYLHNILRPDTDRHLHDHPWNFWSWILSGGYTEVVPAAPFSPLTRDSIRTRGWKRWSWHKLRSTDSHRIVKLLPNTWTLILVGKRQRDWGFWVDGTWIQWEQYIRLRKEGIIK